MAPSGSVLRALFGAKVFQGFAARRSVQLHRPPACLAGSVRQHWVCHKLIERWHRFASLCLVVQVCLDVMSCISQRALIVK